MTPERSRLLVRRKDDHLLCGMRDCGAKIALVSKPIDLDDGDGPLQRVYFERGWWPRFSDNIWVLTRHAERRVRRGLPPDYSRPAKWASGRKILGIKLEWSPAEVVCPSCDSRQWIDCAVLGASISPRREIEVVRGSGRRPDPGLLILS